MMLFAVTALPQYSAIPPRTGQRGFSLLELSIVLIIVGTLTALGVTAGINQIESSRRSQTAEKMAKINEALLIFRKANDRIPCPASLTLASDNANFAVEAANPGICTGGTPAANFSASGVVEGTVPAKALGLPDEFVFDGWGNRIKYAVNRAFTAAAGFSDNPINETCVGVQINDAAGGVRSSGAAYLLLSHGANGHGAYTRAGGAKNTGSTNTDELQNCNCDNTGAATAYNGTYVQKDLAQNAATATDKFDDIVFFRERWQMQSSADTTEEIYTGPSLVAQNAWEAKLFNLSCSVLTLGPAVPAGPAGSVMGARMSYDNEYFVVAYSSAPYFRAYKINGQTVTAFPDPAPDPGGTGFVTRRAIAISQDSQHIAVHAVIGGNGYIKLYKVDSDAMTLTPLADPPGTPIAGAIQPYSLEFSPDNRYLIAIPNAGVRIWKRTGDTYPTVVAVGSVTGFNMDTRFSPDVTMVAQASAFNGVVISTVNTATDTFTFVTEVLAGTAGAYSVDWSPDGKYLAVLADGAPRYRMFKRSGTVFTLLPTPGAGDQPGPPLFQPATVRFASDGKHVIFSKMSNPKTLDLFIRNGDTFTKVPTADMPNDGLFQVGDMDFSH